MPLDMNMHLWKEYYRYPREVNQIKAKTNMKEPFKIIQHPKLVFFKLMHQSAKNHSDQYQFDGKSVIQNGTAGTGNSVPYWEGLQQGKPPNWKGEGQAFQAINEVQVHQSSPGDSSNQSVKTPSCSLAQSGNYLHAALLSINSSISRIVDSGATDLMTGSTNLFVSYSPNAGNKN
ncbi:hypothetical protein CR513_22466, partial [Mucuna pruriens]